LPASFDVEAIVLDRGLRLTLSRQIYGQLRGLIERRALVSGMALPSSRALARALGVGRNGIIAAYDQLALEGYISVRRGSAPRVVDLPARAAEPSSPARAGGRLSQRGQILERQRYHLGRPGTLALHPGMPDPDNFPFNTWAKLLARRAKSARHELFGSYSVHGYPPLRAAIARYVTASRGVSCTAEQIIITNGAQSAFDLLARLLFDPGDWVWMEEPGYYGASSAFLAAGARLAALSVSAAGWRLEPPAELPRAIFVTPSCHHPLGMTMPMEQRLNLIRLAENWDCWIIEDDYDSEYRFQGEPIPALQGLDRSGHVVFVGTFAKILFPAMRLGFVVLPPTVGAGIAAALSATGQFAPLLTQAALADFMNEGHFTRHLRRMRRIYAARRQSFAAACERELGAWLDLQHTDSGIQAVAFLKNGLNDRAVARRAQDQGLNVSPLSLQFQHGNPAQGLVMGFAASDEATTLRAIRKLRSLLEGMQR
jgi:GntR family transcriptional regulator/MocR family aminotransferase